MEKMHICLYDRNWDAVRKEDIRGDRAEIEKAFRKVAVDFPNFTSPRHFRFLVESDTHRGVEYIVDHYGDQTASCTCADFLYRQADVGGRCKHIATRLSQQSGRQIPTGRVRNASH